MESSAWTVSRCWTNCCWLPSEDFRGSLASVVRTKWDFSSTDETLCQRRRLLEVVVTCWIAYCTVQPTLPAVYLSDPGVPVKKERRRISLESPVDDDENKANFPTRKIGQTSRTQQFGSRCLCAGRKTSLFRGSKQLIQSFSRAAQNSLISFLIFYPNFSNSSLRPAGTSNSQMNSDRQEGELRCLCECRVRESEREEVIIFNAVKRRAKPTETRHHQKLIGTGWPKPGARRSRRHAAFIIAREEY